MFSFVISNAGLNLLIKISVPFLMFLYPLAITLIILVLTGRFFGHDRRVYVLVTIFTMVAGVLDCLKGFGIMVFDSFANAILPFYDLGFGWVVPAVIGFVIGILIKVCGKEQKNWFKKY